MPDHEPAREYIHATIGYRTRISEAEQDVLHKLLNTPAVRARFPSLTRENLCAIAGLARRADPGDTAPEAASPEDRVAVSLTPPARLLLRSSGSRCPWLLEFMPG